MTTLVNGNPRIVYGGINDRSRGTNTPEPITFAQHTPLLRLFTQTGPTETTYVGSNLASIFGTETLNRRSKYFNMQSLLAETLLGEGNGFFVKRLQPEDANGPARISLAIEIVADDIPKLVGRLDGFDYAEGGESAGDVIIGDDGEPETVDGYRVRLVLVSSNGADIGSQEVGEGTLVSQRDGSQSQRYPLMELPTSFFGEGGNLNGMRLWSPTINDPQSFDEEAAEKFATRMYRMQFVKRNTAESSAFPIRTLRDEDYVDLCFTPGVYSESTDKEYYAPDVVIPAYQSDGSDGFAPVYSPFSELYVYQDNIETVQAMMFARELELDPSAETHLAGPGQFDIFTGMDIEGYRHVAMHMEGPIDGGIYLGKDSTVYAQGGSDGTINDEEYEKLVNRENLNFGQLGDQYENLNVYPFSVLYDTGLSMEGKFNMMSVLGRRNDLRTVFTTFVESDDRLPTASEEVSRLTALMARLRGFPESVLNGTGVCRAEVIMQSGDLVTGGFNRKVPQLIDYARSWADMAGAANGRMREGRDMDDHPNNMVSLVNNLNVKYFNPRTQSEIWENGGTFSLSYDIRRQYYPAIRSVYADDTSVLMSPITVAICCDIFRVIWRIHAHLSGNATLTKEQLIERSDRLIVRETQRRYNDRVVIEPETYFTDADNERGFSWHCRARVYANNPRTVMLFDLETYRMEDL